MSHIPNAAMKHAAPHHEPEAPQSTPQNEEHQGVGPAAWIAIGGTLVLGAAAAIALPLLRRRTAPVPTRRGKKATRKPKDD